MTDDEKKDLAEGFATRRAEGFNRLRKSAKFQAIIKKDTDQRLKPHDCAGPAVTMEDQE